MTGACRPTPPECIAKALDAHLGNLLTVREKRSAAQAVWDALLAEGREGYTVNSIRYVHAIYDTWERADRSEPDGRIIRVLVVPLAADEEKDNKEDYEGGVNWP